MMTAAASAALSDTEKLLRLREAKGGPWYHDWKPYCTVFTCKSGLERMVLEPYGFRCKSCGNMIGWDLRRLVESPLNKKINEENRNS